VDGVQYFFQVGRRKQGGSAAAKINGFDHRTRAKIMLLKFQLPADHVHHGLHQFGIGAEMEVTVMAGLLAKWDMEINSGQFYLHLGRKDTALIFL